MDQARRVEAAGGDSGKQINRYAHLISSSHINDQARVGSAGIRAPEVDSLGIVANHQNQVEAGMETVGIRTNNGFANQNNISHQANQKPKAPPLGKGPSNNTNAGTQKNKNYANYYYQSFSNVDLKEQWLIMRERILEKVEEPSCQRKLILFIVCCALLLDNMLYMVIVPIIPDYLRSIDAWSTYTENAKWIRTNATGRHGKAKWERVGGNVIYEGEDSAVGFLFASKAIVQLFINPFSGAIIDRIGYEIPMMIGLTVMFFSTMVFACGQTYSILFLARSLQGVGSAFADTSGLAMIADRFTEENERQRALGVALAFISFGCLVAPPFGAVLYQAAGKEVPFIILSLVCLLDGSLLLLVTPPGTFAQCLPNYQPAASIGLGSAHQGKKINQAQQQQQPELTSTERGQENSEDGATSNKRQVFQRQKSISRRHSMTMASAGEAPKGTPIYVLFRDPCIACCSGALIVANVSLAFLEPTISIWIQNSMSDIEEWQMGMIWLPAFFPHVFGVYLTVKLADKYPKYQWLIAAIGLILEGLSCLMIPFCASFWSLMFPISLICFGLALIDTAILPTLGFLVDTRYVSVYGSIYAIADISYSLSYAIGPIIAGGIVEAIGFAALNVLIAIVTLGYTPILMMLRTIHDYEPFEADNSGAQKRKVKELNPFGKFQRPIKEEEEDEDFDSDKLSGQEIDLEAARGLGEPGSRYESPKWAAQKQQQQHQQQALEGAPEVGKKSVLVKRGALNRSESSTSGSRKHTVKIVENQSAAVTATAVEEQRERTFDSARNPFAEN